MVFQLTNDAKIYAMEDGVITSTCDTCYRGLGNVVAIRHKDGINISYCHLSEVKTAVGSAVKKGGIIGTSGKSGLIVENGLGIRLTINDSLINPMEILSKWD